MHARFSGIPLGVAGRKTLSGEMPPRKPSLSLDTAILQKVSRRTLENLRHQADSEMRHEPFLVG
jgi:hypothetical protein